MSDEVYYFQQQTLFADSNSMVLTEPEAWFAANQNNFDALQFLQFIENYAGLVEEKGQQLTLTLVLSTFRELCDKAE